MKTLKKLFILALLIGIAVMVFFLVYKGKTSQLQPSSQPQPELIAKGEYLARAGDCVACHKGSNGQAFAGGIPLDSGSPVGLIYATNITSDPQTGIGNYNLQDFDNALRYGLRKDGASLYPAMPFPSFSITADEDVEALYAYFMQVEPVQLKNKPVSAPWPLSMRWPLNAWRLMFSPSVSPFLAADNGTQIARGQYLIEGLGHCGACHTPRSITMNEKAYTDNSGKLFLSGGAPMEGWVGINLRGDNIHGLGTVSEEELFMLLKTGRNNTSAVFGSMTDVIDHSLQYLNDDDLLAMTRYLKTLAPIDAQNKAFVYDDAIAKALFNGDASMKGGQVYIDHCAACHRTDGKGYAQAFPALAGNPVLQSKAPDNVINIVLKGDILPSTQDAPTAFTMPGFAWNLDDQDIADVSTFARTSWGNQGAAVNASEVAAYRKHILQEMLDFQKAQINPQD